jgi:hypothetical protein
VAIAALFGRGLEGEQMEESNGNKYRFYYIDLTTGKAKMRVKRIGKLSAWPFCQINKTQRDERYS